MCSDTEELEDPVLSERSQTQGAGTGDPLTTRGLSPLGTLLWEFLS